MVRTADPSRAALRANGRSERFIIREHGLAHARERWRGPFRVVGGQSSGLAFEPADAGLRASAMLS